MALEYNTVSVHHQKNRGPQNRRTALPASPGDLPKPAEFRKPETLRSAADETVGNVVGCRREIVYLPDHCGTRGAELLRLQRGFPRRVRNRKDHRRSQNEHPGSHADLYPGMPHSPQASAPRPDGLHRNRVDSRLVWTGHASHLLTPSENRLQ